MQKPSALKLESWVKKSTTYLSETCLFLNTIREWELQFRLTHQPVVSEQEAILYLSQSTISEAAAPRRLLKLGVMIRLRVQYDLQVRLKSREKSIIAHNGLNPLFDITWSLPHSAAFTATSIYQGIIDFARTAKKVTFFPKWNIDTTIQLQALSMHALTHVTTHERKAPINMLFCSKTPKAQQVEGFTRMRITSNYFSHHQPGWYVGTH